MNKDECVANIGLRRFLVHVSPGVYPASFLEPTKESFSVTGSMLQKGPPKNPTAVYPPEIRKVKEDLQFWGRLAYVKSPNGIFLVSIEANFCCEIAMMICRMYLRKIINLAPLRYLKFRVGIMGDMLIHRAKEKTLTKRYAQSFDKYTPGVIARLKEYCENPRPCEENPYVFYYGKDAVFDTPPPKDEE